MLVAKVKQRRMGSEVEFEGFNSFYKGVARELLHNIHVRQFYIYFDELKYRGTPLAVT